MQDKFSAPIRLPLNYLNGLAKLPALWKCLLADSRTVGFAISGTVTALIAGALLLPPLLTPEQPEGSSDFVLDLSTKAIVTDPITQAIKLKPLDSQQRN